MYILRSGGGGYANEDKKDFNAMLQDNKDMPKFQIITDVKSIEKYGGNKMYFAPPIAYDEVMKKIPYGKVITVGKIREFFAKENDADFTEFNFKYPKYTRGYNFITNKLVETTSGYQQIPVPSYKIDSEEKGELSEISLKYLYRMISFCEEHEIKLVLMKRQ